MHFWVKSVYGLHQATKDWYRTHDTIMVEFDSEINKSKSDPGFYHLVKTSVAGSVVPDFWFMVSLHVDDYAMAYSHEAYYASWIVFFGIKFKLSELGDVSNLLGMKILRTPTTISISQSAFIESLGHTYGVTGDKNILTPMSQGVHLTKYTGVLDPGIPYRELNGALLWPARKTHPEIMWGVV